MNCGPYPPIAQLLELLLQPSLTALSAHLVPYLTADRRLQPTSEQTYERGEDDADSDASRPFVISLSHFAPLQELIPEKRMLVHGYLHKVSGSKPLWKQVERLEVWPAVRFASCCQARFT